MWARGALEHTPSVQDMDTSNVVYRVSEWVVAPAADNTEIYTPEFIEQANNTWSMLRIPVDLPSYKHEPYYLVVVAAVDTAASNLTNQPIVDPIWGTPSIGLPFSFTRLGIFPLLSVERSS